MGIIKETNYKNIEREKVYLLKKRTKYEGESIKDVIIAPFLSFDNLKKYVKELLRMHEKFKVNDGCGGTYDDLYGTYTFLIEERELDREFNEISYIRNIPITELKEES